MILSNSCTLSGSSSSSCIVRRCCETIMSYRHCQVSSFSIKRMQQQQLQQQVLPAVLLQHQKKQSMKSFSMTATNGTTTPVAAVTRKNERSCSMIPIQHFQPTMMMMMMIRSGLTRSNSDRTTILSSSTPTTATVATRLYTNVAQTIFTTTSTTTMVQQQQRRWFSAAQLPPHEIVGLPSLSPTMESGSISNWNVKAGDHVVAGDVYASIETDKAVVDFEAQDDGIVAQILVPTGTEVKVNAPVMILVSDPDHVKAFENYTVPVDGTSIAAADAPPAAAATAPPSAVVVAPPIVAASPSPSTTTTTTATGGKMFASPLARKLAKEMGYDIHQIRGTGPNQRIIAADVKEYQPVAAAAAAAAVVSTETVPSSSVSPLSSATPTSTAPIVGNGYVDYPIPTTVAEIAARLGQSKRNVPHYYLTVDINADALIQLRNSINQQLSGNSNAKKNDTTTTNTIGMYEFFIKAAGLSMKTIPSANAAWMETHVRMYDSVDVNIVTGAGDTLGISTIRNITGIGIKSISTELLKATEENSTTIDNGLGTFTMINVGMYGVKSCAPIIREPQACAIAIGALQHKIIPSTTNEKGYTSSVQFTVTASFDHRVVDGAIGAQWLSAFKSYIENPSTLLL